jgi:hypothetical protein
MSKAPKRGLQGLRRLQREGEGFNLVDGWAVSGGCFFDCTLAVASHGNCEPQRKKNLIDAAPKRGSINRAWWLCQKSVA